MVLRTFGAFDNEAFTIDPNSPRGTTGDPIINNSNVQVGTIFQFNAGYPSQIITLDDTSRNTNVFDDDREDDHVITDGGTLVANGTEVESESYHYMRQLDANGDPFGPRITLTVFSQNGQTSNIWGMATDTPLVPGARYVKVGGSNNGDSEYETFVPCFTLGTGIVTRQGERRIEDLRVGDQVITRDNGMQEIRWVGKCALKASALKADRSKRPVRIAKGALGQGMPLQDLYFSPNHRILMTNDENSLLFGEREVFAAAKDLVGRSGVSRATTAGVTYVHVLFDQHETVMSDGVWSESFLPGDMAMKGLERAQQNEIFDLFPELAQATGRAAYGPARRILRRHEAEVAA